MRLCTTCKQMKTIRQQLIALLEHNPMDAREISQELRISEKEVYEHLSHIDRSVKALKKKLRVKPFRCMTCDYIFRDRKRLTQPGRCPKCKHERIDAALFSIV